MTARKLYIKLADLIAKNTTINGDIDKELFIEDISQYFESDNPNFNKVKFEQACYPFRD